MRGGEQCNSGFCILTPEGHQCTLTCEEECWVCVQYTPSLPDQVFICAPGSMDLCRPCNVNSDCISNGADAGQKCISYDAAGSFCGTHCVAEEGAPSCPSGYECLEVTDVSGATVSQCILTEGECSRGQVASDHLTSKSRSEMRSPTTLLFSVIPSTSRIPPKNPGPTSPTA